MSHALQSAMSTSRLHTNAQNYSQTLTTTSNVALWTTCQSRNRLVVVVVVVIVCENQVMRKYKWNKVLGKR